MLVQTYKSLRAKYVANKKRSFDRGNLIFYYVTRPLSFYLTVPFAIFGISANTATAISFIFSLLSCMFWILPISDGFLYASLCYLLWYLVDFVDGNLARFYGKTNYFGKFIDGLVDNFTGLSFFIFMGHGVSHSLNLPYLLYEGIAVAFINIFYAFYFSRKSVLLAEMSEAEGLSESVTPALGGGRLKKIIKSSYEMFYAIIPYLLPVAVVVGFTPYVLHACLTVSLCVCIPHVLIDLYRSAKSMNCFREF